MSQGSATKNSIVRKFFAFLGIFLLSAIFFELGLWQLHRAQATHKIAHSQPEKPVINLEHVAAAGHNLRDASFNRLVTFSGKYIQFFSAPNQVSDSGDSTTKNYSVGLMELSGNRAILVVRGVDSPLPTQERLTVTGRLYPRQNEDHANPAPGVLSRLDPALIASTSDALFDGYVIARSEVDKNGTEIAAERVPSPQLISTVGGFYWQHIAYIITWWFMALLVWFAPFYNRAVARKKSEDEGGI